MRFSATAQVTDHRRRRRLPRGAFLKVFIAGLAIVAGTSAAIAHETDQYSVPQDGREFADLRFWLSEYIYDAIDRAVDKTNRRIFRSLDQGRPTARTVELQSPKYIGVAVSREFPPFVIQTELIERELKSPQVQARYPGLMTGFLPDRLVYNHAALVVDLPKAARMAPGSTILVNGTYMGTDKILHFCQMGHIYFLGYHRALEKGMSPEEAVRKAVELGAGPHPLAETKILGRVATGVISNGDLAADYAGLKFYRNLTEPMKIKDEMRPPLLVRDGEYYRFNTHVRRDSDWFSVFVSDHFNEALNPSEYIRRMDRAMVTQIKERCPAIIEWYRDERGRPFSKQDFERVAQELSTYHGEDYGHQGDLSEMVTIANVCFEGEEEPVQSASAGLQVRLVSDSLDHREAPETVDAMGRTPLWRAARAGRVDDVKRVSNGADPMNADIDGETPLHAAVRSGNAAVVKALLESGADVDVANAAGLTPLHLAVQNNQPAMVDMLLTGGAAAGARDAFGCTPLHDAATKGSEVVALRLIAAGADVNAADRLGTTPLHRAARGGHVAVIEILLAAGANASTANQVGRTPLDDADAGKHGRAVELLRQHGSR